MKWLKKDSSEDDQKMIAESQPEQPMEVYPDEAPQPDALEQPVVAPIQESPEFDETSDDFLKPVSEEPEEEMPEIDELETDTYPPAEKPYRNSRRRRDRTEKDTPIEHKKTGFNPITMFAKTWIGKNWKVMAILIFIFGMALFVRSYYGIVPATDNGFILSGGSDSYYHNYVIDYGQDTGDYHFWDDMLNYPIGTRNPRPPLYDWSVAIGGIAASPLFGGDLFTATNWVFLFSTAFWGALTIFPTYFLAKEAFGKRTGIIAAFLLAVMPGHIQRSVFTNADHDAMALFFIVTTFFFFLKALKLMEQKTWVSTWRKPKIVIDGVKNQIMTNRISILYAVMAGLSLASVALIWKGYAYVIVIMSVYLLVQLLLNRFRNVDSLGMLSIYFVSVGVGLLLAFPYYYQSIQIKSWFDTPTLMWLGASVFAMIFVVTKRYPWVLVFSSIIGLSILFILTLAMAAPSLLDSLMSAILSGAGYFIQNKQYQTIAEAQAPPFSNLAMSFGIITFWLAFVGIAWAAIQLPKSWKADFTFIFIWTATSIYMAVTAARFMFNAGPAFAMSAGWIIALIISKLDMKKFMDNMRRASQPHMSAHFKMGLLASVSLLIVMSLVLYAISSIAYPVFVIGLTAVVGIYMINLIAETNPNRSYNMIAILIPASGVLFYILAKFYTDWELTSATHGFILFVMLFAYFVLYMTVRRNTFFLTAGIIFLAFFIIMPNVWGGLDAGIPYETKKQHDLEIYQAAPTFMQPGSYDAVNGSNWYLGGFGYSLPLNSRYWPAAYDWLATQDTEIYPPSERPAFLSWWDYGFEIVNEGKHPTVADNFLGGHQLAGNFIMSQSEEDAIALFCARVLEGDWNKVWDSEPNHLDPAVIDLLQDYGISVSMMNEYLEHPGNHVDEILAHPEIYGPRDDIIQDANARYILIRHLITEQLGEERVVDFYHDLSQATGKSIRYFGIDSRLFPFSADNTGIFYAPAKLSDHRIDDVGNQPYDFWEIKAVGEYGGEYNLGEIPPDVKLNQDNPYKIVYHDMFYNSMLYKCFIGYSANDTKKPDADGIPGLSGSLAQDPIMPGWNMTHFKLEHRTAYWNPYSASEIQNHTDAWQAMNFWDAYKKQQEGDGISDLSDRSSLYQGVMMLKYYDGAIISGKVTMEDGTPLGGVSVTVSDEFSIPHQRVVTDSDGSYSIIAPYGNVTITASTGAVDPMSLVGSEMNITKMYIEDYQAMRKNEDRDNNGQPDYLIDFNPIIKSGSLNGVVFWDNNQDGNFDEADEIIPNANLEFRSKTLPFSHSYMANDTGGYSIENLPPGDYTASVSVIGSNLGMKNVTVTSDAERQELLAVPPSPLTGTVRFQDDGTPAVQATVTLWNTEFGLKYSAETNDAGNYSIANIPHADYYAQAISGSYASQIMRLSISQGSVNNTHDFTLVPSSSIDGELLLPNGMAVPNTIVKFSGKTGTVIVQSDQEGKYHAELENGLYDIYAEYTDDNDIYVAMDKILLDSNIVDNISFEAGTGVNGIISGPDELPESNATVIFENVDSGFTIRVITDNRGVYSAEVPRGTYIVQASTIGHSTQFVTRSFNTYKSELDFSVIEGIPVSGTVFWDQNNDGVANDFELIKDAKVSFTDPSGTVAMATTDSNGSFMTLLYQSTPYSISIDKVGFESISFGTHTPEQISGKISVSMIPFKVPVSGTLLLDNKPLTDQNIPISFLSTTQGGKSVDIQVARDGTYSGELLPGIYTVTFTHNLTSGDDSQVFQIDENLDLETGLYVDAPVHMNLDAKIRQKVLISVVGPSSMDYNVSFTDGPEDKRFSVLNGTGEFYVMEGNYVLSATNAENSTYWVGMQDISVSNSSNSFTINVEEGRKITGTLYYGAESVQNQRITFRDKGTNGSVIADTDDNGAYVVILAPSSQYLIDIDFVEYDKNLDAYHYFANRTIDAETSVSTFDIHLDREEYYTKVSGNLSTGGAGVDIIFYSLDENVTVRTDSLGHYEASLKPGVYSAYIHDQFNSKAFLDIIVIEIDTKTIDFDMAPAYRISGTVYYDLNQHEPTELTVISNISMIPVNADDNGYYEIWLPSGDYNIVGSLYAQKGGISVYYQLNKTFELTNGDKQMNLPLTMVEERDVVISFNQDQFRETGDNVTVTYDFIVKNSGNIRDTYDLAVSGGNPDWITELSSNEVTLDPGLEEYAKVSVTAHIPEGANIEQNSINLVATSRNDPSATYNTVMSVPIRQQYALDIEPVATSPTFANGIINSNFAVKNTGNGNDIYTLYIGNLDDLAANGWQAELGSMDGAELLNDNTRLANVTIASGGMSNIPIILTPISDIPARQVSVLITGFSQNNGNAVTSHHIILKYPELQVQTGNLTVVGDEVSSVAAGEEVINAGVMVVSVIVSLGLFYYARKKRWIR